MQSADDIQRLIEELENRSKFEEWRRTPAVMSRIELKIKLKKIKIQNYASIGAEGVEITFPKDKPVILFGPNNAGKTNILSGIQSFWDIYGRQSKIPETSQGSPETQEEGDSEIANAAKISNGLTPDTKITLYYEDPGCHEDRITELVYDSENKRFLNIKPRPDEPISIGSTFIGTDYGKVFSELRNILKSSNFTPGGKRIWGHISSALGKIKHFEKINAGNSEELLPGKGELAFLGLVVNIFKASELVNENNANDTLILLDEPETHLHFLAQEGLMEIINSICKEEGVQVVIATHAENFLDADDLEGFVRVYKENGITKVRQLTDNALQSTCNKNVPIGNYWSVKLNTDQLKGFFADIILLVEGQTEQYALPVYLTRSFLSENGVQIVPCYSKSAIPTYWRLFTAYGYKCFIVFDHDDDIPPKLEGRAKKAETQEEKKAIQGEIKKEIEKNQNLEKLCKFKASPSCPYTMSSLGACFKNNWELYFKEALGRDYQDIWSNLQKTIDDFSNKALDAKAIAQEVRNKGYKMPPFITAIKARLRGLSEMSEDQYQRLIKKTN